MIGWLRGRVLSATGPGEVLLDVGGVGYRLTVPGPALSELLRGGSGNAELHVHTHVREDAIVLYGFTTIEDRRCFETLIGAHGVGPTLAVSLLSALPSAELARAVADDDVDALCQVPGVGRKTAQRLILDLKSKFESWASVAIAGPNGAGPELVAGESRSGGGVRAELRAALVELGYSAEEVKSAVEAVGTAGPVEELLRLALKELSAPLTRGR